MRENWYNRVKPVCWNRTTACDIHPCLLTCDEGKVGHTDEENAAQPQQFATLVHGERVLFSPEQRACTSL